MVESLTIVELGRSAAGVKNVILEELRKDESLKKEDLYTVGEERKGRAPANAGLECYGLLNAELLTELCRCLRELGDQKSSIWSRQPLHNTSRPLVRKNRSLPLLEFFRYTHI